MRCHVRVVLEAMQIDPGKPVLAVNTVTVMRLMHMPAENEVQLSGFHT
jgi:hypothetical protein